MLVAWVMRGVDLSLEVRVVGRGIVTQRWQGVPESYPQDNLLISSLALLTHTARIESLRLAVFSPRLELPVVGRGIVTQLLRQGHPKVNLKTTC